MKKLFVIGSPIGHSLSPAMHNAALKQLGLDFQYSALEIAPEKLAVEIAKLKQPEVAGFNVTVPHKETVIPFLDKVTDLAKLIGAVNTVKNENGRLIGYNTDAEGFLQTLVMNSGIDPIDKKIVILGAGGAARAIAAILCKNDADHIMITDVDDKKAAVLIEDIKERIGGNLIFQPVNSEKLINGLAEADIVINATPLGMPPLLDFSPLPETAKLKSGSVAFDVVYNPATTVFIKQARSFGAQSIGGLDMLVRQGALAFKIFTGKEAPFETMKAAAEKALNPLP
jgi:shikimate dehydrogenase